MPRSAYLVAGAAARAAQLAALPAVRASGEAASAIVGALVHFSCAGGLTPLTLTIALCKTPRSPPVAYSAPSAARGASAVDASREAAKFINPAHAGIRA